MYYCIDFVSDFDYNFSNPSTEVDLASLKGNRVKG